MRGRLQALVALRADRGVTVERGGSGEHWMRDLWLAKRLTDATAVRAPA